MKLLLILLSVMSFTVQDKRTVEAEGTWPYSMEATYFCTYQKGQVRSGDSAMLSVSHLGGITVEKIEVEMKSNKNSGAGTFRINVNGSPIAQKQISNLTNEYVTVDFMITSQADVNELDILLVGSENSLYINKYIIQYTQADPWTVTLMKGDEQVDVLSGSTVVLPEMPQEGEWRFIGWTGESFYERNEYLPGLIAAGNYHPTADVTLWAVYEHMTQTEELIATELQDGVYVYANMSSSMAMSGNAWGGKAGASAMDMNDQNQMYEVLFDSEGKATIQLIYVYGTEYIGFEGNQLENTPSKWDVYHEGQKTAFYTTKNNKTYVLFPGKLVNETTGEFATTLLEVPDLEMTPTSLLHADMSVILSLTCYPETVPYSIELTEEERNGEGMGVWRIPFGNYELIIQNGKKRVELRE